MIGVEGQYLVQFEVGNKKDFLQEEDFLKLTMLDEAGNSLPTFEVVFKFRDESLIPYLNEGNPFSIAIGKTKLSMFNVRFLIVKKTIIKIGLNEYQTQLFGILSPIKFLTDARCKSYSRVSGVEAIKSCVSKYFTPAFNIERSMDNQVWLQNNISDKSFTSNTWIHSYIPNSFIAVAISSDYKYILKDIKKTLKGEPDWKFVSTPSREKEIAYVGDIEVRSNTGFMNMFAGYKQNRVLYNIVTGETKEVIHNLKPMMAISKFLERSSLVNSGKKITGFINDNVHTKYYDAEVQNISHLAAFSSSGITLNYQNRFEFQRPLDSCIIMEPDLQGRKSAEQYSGVYIITRLLRRIENKSITTIVDMYREGFNLTRGEFQ